MDPDSRFIYRANEGYVGLDSWTYRLWDGLAHSEPASMELWVYNHAPFAIGEWFSLEPGQTFAVFVGDSVPPSYTGLATTTTALLANDWDVDNDALSLVEVGTLSTYWQYQEEWDAWVFSVPQDFSGIDTSFEYLVTDGVPVNSPYSDSYDSDYLYSASWEVALVVQVGDNGTGGDGGGGGGGAGSGGVNPTIEVSQIEFQNGISLIDESNINWEQEIFPEFPKPHWRRDPGMGAVYSPYALIANQDVNVVAKFKLSAQFGKATKLKLKGDGPDTIDFDPVEVTLKGNETEFSVALRAKDRFKKVRALPQFNIDWSWSLDGTNWNPAGQSGGYVYVLANRPRNDIRPYHTMVWLGSTAADGIDANNRDGIIEAIWNRFKTLQLATYWNTNSLTYWKRWDLQPLRDKKGDVMYADALMKRKDGACGEWAEFFRNTLALQGVGDGKFQQIFPVFPRMALPDWANLGMDPNRYEQIGLAVKNWQLGEPRLDLKLNRRKVNISGERKETELPDGTFQYNWNYSEAQDKPGLPGQSNPNPHSLFYDHVVYETRLGMGERARTVWYDPSYGQVYEGANVDELFQDFQRKAVEAFFVHYGFRRGARISEETLGIDINRNGQLDALYFAQNTFQVYIFFSPGTENTSLTLKTWEELPRRPPRN